MDTVKLENHLHDLPFYSIIIWYGDGDKVPKGWVLCNGKNNTPDLRERFVLGASKKYPKGEKGGEKEIKLTIDHLPRHNHRLSRNGRHSHQYRIPSMENTGNGIHDNRAAGGNVIGLNWTRPIYQTVSSGDHSHRVEHEGGDKKHTNMPPFLALHYMMKLPKD